MVTNTICLLSKVYELIFLLSTKPASLYSYCDWIALACPLLASMLAVTVVCTVSAQQVVTSSPNFYHRLFRKDEEMNFIVPQLTSLYFLST